MLTPNDGVVLSVFFRILKLAFQPCALFAGSCVLKALPLPKVQVQVHLLVLVLGYGGQVGCIEEVEGRGEERRCRLRFIIGMSSFCWFWGGCD